MNAKNLEKIIIAKKKIKLHETTMKKMRRQGGGEKE